MRIQPRFAWAFAAVLLWKLALLVLVSLPPPSNDSYFYDGAVVNLIRHGSYSNPSIALTLTISGNQVFSAYPPLYQWALLPWMWLFGTSEMSAMVFHFVLFAIYAGILYAVLTRLANWAVVRDGPAGPDKAQPPRAPFHIAALFLLAITFHDRPDSLAHVFGLTAVYGFARVLEPGARSAWAWFMVSAAILALATGLQIGALYLAVLWVGTIGAHLTRRAQFPVGPMAALVLIPVLLIGWVVAKHPLLWQGFTEHARLTPALTGLRAPRLDELLKIGRAAPGIFAVAGLLVLVLGLKLRTSLGTALASNRLGNLHGLRLFLLATVLPALGVLTAAMFFVTPNAGSFTMYLQPVIVGAFLLLVSPRSMGVWAKRFTLILAALAVFASIRAVGLSTWGVACAVDCSRTEALSQVSHAISEPEGTEPVVLSPAYLYEASRQLGPRAIHCDWLQAPGPDQLKSDLEGLERLKPRKLVLTQFDYFRRYEPLLAALKEQRINVSCTISNTAGVRTPDSIPPLRRVLQHISWAPVIVTIEW